MRTLEGVLIVLTGVVFAIGGLLKEDGRQNIAYYYFVLGYVLSGLTILLIVTHAFLAWRRRSRRRAALTGRRINPNDRRAFGVLWDSDLNPLCPVCGTSLTPSTKNLIYPIDPFNNSIPPPKPVPHCLKCGEVLPLYDDDGRLLTLAEAKKRLSEKKAEPETKALGAQKAEQRPDPESDKLNNAIARLHALIDRVPEDDIEEKYVNIYHQTLTDIERETRRDMARFRIPPDELRTRITSYGAPRIGNRPGAKPTYSKERYCDRAIFLIAIDNAINSLKDDPPTADTQQPAELESAEYQPDETERRILAYLFRDKVDRDIGSIVKALNFAHAEEARFHIERLTKHHYVEPPRPFRASHLFPGYKLGQKGREFVIQNDLHREEVKPVTPEPLPPQLQTTISSVQSAAYEPDEEAIEILKEIAKGNGYESQITEVLKLNAVQVSISLSLLNQHDYIELHRMENRAPYYRLTDKGNQELAKPVHDIPHASGELDETSVKILTFIAHKNDPTRATDLVSHLNLHVERIKHYLSQLEGRGYIYSGLPLGRGLPYYLTDKGRQELMQRGII